MTRRQALVIALALAVAIVAGVFAALRTVGLGAEASAAGLSDSEIAQRAAALDRAEAKLRQEAADRPPALPPARAAASTARAQPQTVIYRRPAPIVLASSHEDDEHVDEDGEHEDDHGDDGGHDDD
ncbi:MAG TPA: hypothetical protein VLB86_14520 [Gaiellaceae bacterium]|nr:hypothetical protein [Gaiellaceae bacterium]